MTQDIDSPLVNWLCLDAVIGVLGLGSPMSASLGETQTFELGRSYQKDQGWPT